MIPKETIDKIFETARIEEVVAGFVQLKKRGANFIGIVLSMMKKLPHLPYRQLRVFTNALDVEKEEIALVL